MNKNIIIVLFSLALCMPFSCMAYASNMPQNTDFDNEIVEAEQFLSENQIDVPVEIEELCEYYGKKNNITPELLEAIIWKESRFDPRAMNSSRSCVGLMQINIRVHSDRISKLKIRNIFDPAGNIKVGADYLGELLMSNDLEVAIMLYNGDKNAYQSNYISKYAQKVLKVSEALERVHNK